MDRASDNPPRGMNPIKVFVALLVFLVAVGGAVLLTRPDPAPPPTATDEPNFTLTDSEAIARFKELDALRIRAYEERDVSLIDEFLTSDSPIRERVIREITRLRRDGAAPRISLTTEHLSIRSNTGESIELTHTFVWDVLFTRGGRDVTTRGGKERQVVEWRLQRSGARWLLHDAVVIEARPVR